MSTKLMLSRWVLRLGYANLQSDGHSFDIPPPGAINSPTAGCDLQSLSGIMDASMEDLARCPGIGERKVPLGSIIF